jgi:hypothetical protein
MSGQALLQKSLTLGALARKVCNSLDQKKNSLVFAPKKGFIHA